MTGAEVLLSCNNTKYPLRVKGTSDKNGYFFIKSPKTLTTYGFHRCNVRLMASPMATCNEPTDLHGGLKGSKLVPNKKPPLSNPLPYEVFTVGPLAFQPSSKTPCPRESKEDWNWKLGLVEGWYLSFFLFGFRSYLVWFLAIWEWRCLRGVIVIYGSGGGAFINVLENNSILSVLLYFWFGTPLVFFERQKRWLERSEPQI